MYLNLETLVNELGRTWGFYVKISSESFGTTIKTRNKLHDKGIISTDFYHSEGDYGLLMDAENLIKLETLYGRAEVTGLVCPHYENMIEVTLSSPVLDAILPEQTELIVDLLTADILPKKKKPKKKTEDDITGTASSELEFLLKDEEVVSLLKNITKSLKLNEFLVSRTIIDCSIEDRFTVLIGSYQDDSPMGYNKFSCGSFDKIKSPSSMYLYLDTGYDRIYDVVFKDYAGVPFAGSHREIHALYLFWNIFDQVERIDSRNEAKLNDFRKKYITEILKRFDLYLTDQKEYAKKYENNGKSLKMSESAVKDIYNKAGKTELKKAELIVKYGTQIIDKIYLQLHKYEQMVIAAGEKVKMFRENDSEEKFTQRYRKELELVNKNSKVLNAAISENQLIIHTDMLYCENPQTHKVHEIGKFIIMFELSLMTGGDNEGLVKWINVTHKIKGFSNQFMNAPHIFNDGHACLGSIAGTFSKLLNNHEIASAVDLAIQFVESVNPVDAAGSFIGNWPIVETEKKNEETREETEAELAETA
jgi:hypothetical protein